MNRRIPRTKKLSTLKKFYLPACFFPHFFEKKEIFSAFFQNF